MSRDLRPGQIMGTNEENPNWREDIVRRVMDKRQKSLRGRSPTRILRTNADPEWVDLAHRAAAMHGISLSSYVRRIVSVQMAVDLEANVYDILGMCPPVAIAKYLGYPNRNVVRGQRDDGEGIEKWCPHPECDGEHLLDQR